MRRGIFQTKDTTAPLLKAGEALSRRARLWMFWERYAPVLAVAVLCTALFISAAYIGLWERIGDPWRMIAAIVSVYFIIKAAARARKLNPPSLSEAERRVENDSGIAHRPLEALRDRPAPLGGHSSDGKLWTEHQKRARSAAERLTAAKPVAVIGPRDKYLLRFITPIVLGLAVITGFGDNGERLRRALTPNWQSPINPEDVTFDAWVDPPDYTGRPPVYFKGKQTVAIPAGSELVARIQGAKDAPRLKLSRGGLFGTKYLKLNRLGPKSFEARTVLNSSLDAGWRIGMTRRTWKLNVLEDTPPTVGWVVEPAADKRDRLSFQYYLNDDYGVEQLELEMQLLEDEADVSRPAQTLRAPVPLTGTSVRETKGTDAVLDLTKHIWAGRKVSARLVATDGKGQSVTSELAYFTVPDKIFIEPLAKAVAEQRTLIMAGLSGDAKYAEPLRLTQKEWNNRPYFDDWRTEEKLGRAPQDIQRAAQLIHAITDAPAGLYEDPAVFMGLKNVLGTLRHSYEIEALRPLPSQLWNIAIRAEFGTLGSALEEMKEAEANLNEGMARRAPQREIDTLFNRYDEAVERYIEELRKNALDDMAETEGGNEGGGGRNTDEIEELLKAIEDANRIGDTEGARKALKKLAEFLENMKIQMAQGGGGSGGDPSQGEMSEEMKESLEDLADLLGEQRELQDETEQAERQAENEAQSGQQSETPSGNGSQSGGQNPSEQNQEQGQNGEQQQALSADELAERQSKLQELLDGVREKLPEGIDAPAGLANGESDDGNGGQGDEEAQAGGGGTEENSDTPPNGGGGEQDGEPAPNTDNSLASAGEAMRRAEEALKSGDLEGAAQAQEDVIAALRAAAQALVRQTRGDQDGQQAERDGTGNPLGQDAQEGQNGSNNDLSQQDIDQRDNATRSRELMEELRRRAAEQEREQSERDYLERLLKRF